ncbi:MAG: hypothetical protein IT201_08725 [Thermoleophilia bacterium]|nr:hypothetical protein [Thermoleophilia bacterium]
MRPAKSEELARKQREARSKKALLLLLPVLIALAVFQGPRLMRQLGDAKEATEAKQGEVVQGFEELAPNGPPTATGEAQPAPDAQAALAAADGIADTDTPATPADADLVSFTRFEARDPFVQLVDDTEGDESADGSSPNEETTSAASTSASTSATSSSATASSTSSGSSDPTTATGGDTSSGSDPATEVTLTVNGDVIVVAVGDPFPAADPAFKVVAIEGDVVKIGLASGSFSNGVETLDLAEGESVTLISQPDGARFTIKVTSIG